MGSFDFEDRALRALFGLAEHEKERAEEPPPEIPRYEIRRPVGEGATAVVYAARDRRLGRPVALKILRESASLSEIARERFRREAHAAAGLAHPNIVTLYDAGEHDGRFYLVLELVDGQPLSEALKSAPRDKGPLGVLVQAARGVAALHARGVVHRDLKPGNILVTATGTPKVGDFGLAHLSDSERELTRAGTALGTPLYMAPEQVQGRPDAISPRTDVYALGAILYEILTGRLPHDGETVGQIYASILHDDPVRPRKRDARIDVDVEAIALKALEKEPARRYPNAGAFADDLERYLAGESVEAQPATVLRLAGRKLARHKAIVAAALLGLAVAGGVLAPRLAAERREARDVRRLMGLWNDVLLAKQGWYQAQKDPAVTRAEIERAIGRLDAYVRERPDEPDGYYVRARAKHALGDVEGAWEDVEEALRRARDFVPAIALRGWLGVERLWYRPLLEGSAAADEREVRRAVEAFDGLGERWAEEWGLARMEEEVVAATVARALKAVYDDGTFERARAFLEEAQRRGPSEEYCAILGTWETSASRSADWQTEALRLRPHFFKARFLRANARTAAGAYAEAEADFTAALALAPRPSIVHHNRGVARDRAGNAAGAIEDFGRAIALGLRHAAPYHARGAARLRGGDFAGAEADASEAIRLDPSFAAAYANRALARARLGRMKEAVEDAEAATRADPKHLGGWINLSLTRLALGDGEGAAAAADEALRLSPKEAAAYANRAAARIRQGRWTEAVEDASEALRLNPRLAAAHNSRAAARLGLGDPRGAVEDATRAAELEPSNGDAFLYRAAARSRLGEQAEAWKDAERALALNPAHPHAYLYRGIARGALGDAQGCAADMGEVLRLNPEEAQAYAARSGARLRLADPRGALADADKALELQPALLLGLQNRAAARMSLGDFRGGIADADEVLRRAPADAQTWTNRAGAKSSLGDHAGALADASEAIRLNPAHVQAYRARAAAHKAAGDLPKAVDDYRAALVLRDDPDVRLYLASALADLSESEPASRDRLRAEAIELLERALRLAPADWRNRDAAMSRLSRIRAS